MNNLFKIGFLLLMLMIVMLINLNYLFSENKLINVLEKRVYHQMPLLEKVGWSKFPNLFDLHFSDTFGFRSFFIIKNNKIKGGIFQEDVCNNILIGKNDRLFFGSAEIIDDITGKNIFNNKELTDYKKRINHKVKLLKQHNLKGFKTFFPDAHLLYKEELPQKIKYLKSAKTNRLAQVKNNVFKPLKSNHLQYIDLLPSMESVKDKSIYFKQDTHWNEHGAFLAYQQLIAAIAKEFPMLKAYKKKDFDMVWADGEAYFDSKEFKANCQYCFTYGKEKLPYYFRNATGDLLGNTTAKNNPIPVFIYKNKSTISANNEKYMDNLYIEATFKNPAAQTNLRLALFGDSFSTALYKFLTLHFKELHFVRGGVSKEQLEKHHVDLVLEAHVGRSLHMY